jgi:hypothetical protein
MAIYEYGYGIAASSNATAPVSPISVYGIDRVETMVAAVAPYIKKLLIFYLSLGASV